MEEHSVLFRVLRNKAESASLLNHQHGGSAHRRQPAGLPSRGLVTLARPELHEVAVWQVQDQRAFQTDVPAGRRAAVLARAQVQHAQAAAGQFQGAFGAGLRQPDQVQGVGRQRVLR